MGVQQGLAAGSPDGNIYLIRSTSPARVYVIPTAGQVAREFLIKLPRPGMIPVDASVTQQGELLLEFGQMGRAWSAQAGPAIVLANPLTGKITEYYAQPSGQLVFACSDPKGSLLFLTASRTDRLEVAKFAPE